MPDGDLCHDFCSRRVAVSLKLYSSCTVYYISTKLAIDKAYQSIYNRITSSGRNLTDPARVQLLIPPRAETTQPRLREWAVTKSTRKMVMQTTIFAMIYSQRSGLEYSNVASSHRADSYLLRISITPFSGCSTNDGHRNSLVQPRFRAMLSNGDADSLQVATGNG